MSIVRLIFWQKVQGGRKKINHPGLGEVDHLQLVEAPRWRLVFRQWLRLLDHVTKRPISVPPLSSLSRESFLVG